MTKERLFRDKRTEILEIAGPLFLEHGYQGTSMSRISAAVGGSKATLYAYFESKEALFEAYLQMRVHSRGAEVFALPRHSDDMELALTRLGLKYVELITGDDALAMMRLLYHEAPRFPEIGRIFHETCILRGRGQLAEYLSRADAAGVLKVPDPDLAAEQFLTLCQTNLVLPLMLCVKTRIAPSDAEEIVKAAVSMLLAAYSAK